MSIENNRGKNGLINLVEWFDSFQADLIEKAVIWWVAFYHLSRQEIQIYHWGRYPQG